ncbi:hypothetical protein [Pararhodobacter zhoushanensis]|uniref:hypothetical protein n=1 Tax=Pararhodobacter zhoushanensis TaxID=2479545 RepID=UPI000F8DB291|nr:hypothetical protein [Pararhodobacter zhoushanensis]
MIAFIMGLGRRVQTWLALAAAALVAVLAAYAAGRRDGSSNQREEDAQDTRDAVERGRDAVRRDDVSDPAERLRRNDGRWM